MNQELNKQIIKTAKVAERSVKKRLAAISKAEEKIESIKIRVTEMEGRVAELHSYLEQERQFSASCQEQLESLLRTESTTSVSRTRGPRPRRSNTTVQDMLALMGDRTMRVKDIVSELKNQYEERGVERSNNLPALINSIVTNRKQALVEGGELLPVFHKVGRGLYQVQTPFLVSTESPITPDVLLGAQGL